MNVRVFLRMLCLLCLPLAVSAQAKDPDQPIVNVTKIADAPPSNYAYIVKYHVDDAPAGSDYETGSLHIIYSDKTEVIEKLPPKQKSTADNVVYDEVGITDLKLSEDRRTIAWTENFANGGTSYSIPMVLAIYRSGKNLVEIQQGQMVWNWMFVDSGKRIATVWGPVHGSDIGDYQLYDTETGRMIERAIGDKKIESKDGTIHGVGPGAPAWVKEMEKLQNGG